MTLPVRPTPALLARTAAPVKKTPSKRTAKRARQRERRAKRIQKAVDLARWENEGGALPPRDEED